MDHAKKNKRVRWLIDPQVQTAISLRLVLYWSLGIMFVVLPIALYRTVQDPGVNFITHLGDTVMTHLPVLIMATLMLPMAIFDALRFSHRFAGPVFRVRKELKRFEETGTMENVRFRERDFWTDMSGGLNSLIERIDDLESQVAEELEKDEQYSL